ncbi:MAG: ComEC/Rec2 family competence protein [Kiritimatiellia bacterium]|jgi:ComEC/Rec2-related protein|nr:ComEC/Rec2 family competence protein [Kiritimatiellia bacterium]
MTQNKLIAFCYLFIVGIGLAMAFPLGSAAVSPLTLITLAVGLVTAGALYVARRRRPVIADDSLYAPPTRFDTLQVSAWVLLLVAGLLFGYTRYLAMIQPPDQLVGRVRFDSERVTWTPVAPMSATSFLKIRTLAPVENDIDLRLVGRVEALQPARDENDQPILDDQGRWNFTQTDLKQSSEPLHIPAGTPAGVEVLVTQPFSHLDRVEAINQPASGLLAILKPVNTVSLFARSGRNVVPVSILGRITADPWVYSFKTVLAITPDYIQYRPDGPFFPVERQTVRVTVNPDMPGYERLARSPAYGYDVALSGGLIAPPPAANEGAFDQAKYLRNYNIGGQMMLRTPRDGSSPLSIIIPQGSDGPRDGNGLVEFSLYLRDEMVRVIKQTMPQPNSAFLGALTLGLRYGMQNTVSIASDQHSEGVVAPILNVGSNSNERITDEFRASGTSHVLAVSGLHVTIITVMFMGIFTLLKISKKVYVPFVIFALVIFAIITGARPSTLRAVIMNSLFLLTWGYLGQGVRSSALLGVPIAAFIILLQNPAMAVDPSFTLSFGAILSLALITQPFFDIFKKAYGNQFIALVLMVVVLTWVFATHWLLVITLRFWVGYALLGVVLFWLARVCDRRDIKPIGNYGFANIHPGVGGFIAAQFGLQIGMMIPLSAYYFYRWPVAGAYANLLAIPLVGIVLQLSMLAGLIGLIPGFGIYIAIFLNAANWIFSSMFLWIGHYFSSWFAYPFVVKPTLRWLFIYYAACAVFVWWRPLWFRIVRPRWNKAKRPARLLALTAVALVIAGIFASGHAEKKVIRHDGQLAISILSVRYGSGILIDTPDGKAILVDTAYVQTDRGRRNDAERTIFPHLCLKRIGHLDALILTSRNPEHMAGAPTILEHLDVDQLLYPASVAPRLAEGEIADLLAARAPERFKHRLSSTTITPRALVAGERLFESEVDGKPFAIEVLGPPAGDQEAPLSLRVVFGDFALLIPSDMTFAQQQALLESASEEALKAQVVIAPGHGTAGLESVTIGMPKNVERSLSDITGKLLQTAGAEAVVFEFGNPRPVVGDKYRIALKLHGAARRMAEDLLPEARHLATDTDGAISILSDGSTYSLDARYDSEVGFADAPTSLEIGW